MNSKISNLFYNSKFTDVKFLISPQETVLFAHKLILAISSSEFENLSNIVFLPEYTFNGFREFLRYIYTNEIILDEKNIIEVFQLSEKFQIKSLVKLCTEKIKNFLSSNENCDFLTNWLGIWVISDVKNELINYCGKNPLKYFNSENVLILEKNDLEKILKLDFVEAPEADFYNLALMWSKSQCIRNNMETSDKNLREFLGDLFYLIRFPSMTSDEFENCFNYTSELLTIDESLFILYFIRTGGGETKFCRNPRGILIENDFDFDSGSEFEEIEIQQIIRDQKCKKCFLGKSLKSYKEISYKNFNSLSFSTNNDILLKGFTIRTIPDIYEKGIKRISIMVTTGWNSIKSQILYNKSLKIHESFSQEFFKHDLFFDDKIVCKEKVPYNFCFKIDEDDNSSLNKGVGYCVPFDAGCVNVAEIVFQISENNLFVHEILFERI